MSSITRRVEHLLGTSVVSTVPVAGGDVCVATRMRLSDGRTVLVKTRPQPPDGFFAREAAGLDWLREAGGVRVPDVLGHDDTCLVLTWIEPARPTPEHASAFGRALATTHAAGAEQFGSTADGKAGFIGPLPLPARASDDWAEFYATQRVLPYLKLAVDRGRIAPADAADVDGAVRRITTICGPPEPPSRLHGDLWNGNVLWSSEARSFLVDPAAHGGHRETDLAMLTLLGLPQLTRALEAYREAHPLADGWADRVPLHQLHPLLVHTCLFGASYGARAGRAARSLR